MSKTCKKCLPNNHQIESLKYSNGQEPSIYLPLAGLDPQYERLICSLEPDEGSRVL